LRQKLVREFARENPVHPAKPRWDPVNFFLFSLSLNDVIFCHLKCQNAEDWRQKKNKAINLINVILCLWNSAEEQKTALLFARARTHTPIMTIDISFVVPCYPQSMFVIIITIIINNWKRGKEKERLIWSCYLKIKAMVMEGWLINVTFFPSISIFCSLHLCSCFSLLVFSLFFFYFSCPRCLSLFLFLLVSLCIIYISSFFVCVFLYYLFVVLPFFVCSSWFLWVCICWLDQQPAMRRSWSSLLLEKGHMSLCLLYVFFLCFFLLTRVNSSDPWPDHLTGSGFKTMIDIWKFSIFTRKEMF